MEETYYFGRLVNIIKVILYDLPCRKTRLEIHRLCSVLQIRRGNRDK